MKIRRKIQSYGVRVTNNFLPSIPAEDRSAKPQRPVMAEISHMAWFVQSLLEWNQIILPYITISIITKRR